MSDQTIEIQGTVQPDGTLALDHRLDLPAGRVRVTLQPLAASEPPNLARFQVMMEQIWAGQNVRGHVPRTREEIDAGIHELRDEAEEELQAAERLHEECQDARQVGDE